MFLVHALPADQGDCLWIEYGPAAAPRRILIDGGTARTYPRLRAHIAALPRSQRRFELLIVSHIDNDHIDGALELLADRTLGVRFGDVWFNGYRHTAAARPRRGLLRRVALFEGVDCTDGDGPRVACAMLGCSVRGVLGPMDMTRACADAAARIPVPVPVGP